ncbi:hypothetical protein SNE40_000319 [Patella caerulea]|uniref:Uncharacterized protein n=1 Tax=Patella caerulea TaxID=87958 RepID=A0AAN8KGC8_PATCE
MDKVALVGFTALALLAIATGAALTTQTQHILTTAIVTGCLHDGRFYKEGEQVNKNGSPCSPCFCSYGRLINCMIIDCLKPNCVDSVRNGCCPTCPNGGNCQLPDGSILKDGDVRTLDDGRTCRCFPATGMIYGLGDPGAACTLHNKNPTTESTKNTS